MRPFPMEVLDAGALPRNSIDTKPWSSFVVTVVRPVSQEMLDVSWTHMEVFLLTSRLDARYAPFCESNGAN